MVTTEHRSLTRTLERVVTALRTSQQAEAPLQLIVEEITREFGCQTCAIILRDEKTGHFRVRHHCGLSHLFVKSFYRPFEVDPFKEVIWTGKPLIIQDARLSPQLEAETRLEKPFGSGVIVRIHANHSRLGYLHVDFREPRDVTSEDVEVLQLLADMAGVAILKTRLYEENVKLNPLDQETGLLRYSHFVTKLENYLAHAKTLSENFAVIILDVDHYGELVNMYGGPRAHGVFQKICAEVNKAISPFDAASRYGLDEIILFLSNTAREQAVGVAEQICRTIAEWRFPELDTQVTVSAGLAMYPHHGSDLHSLVAGASKALYETQRIRRSAVRSLNTGNSIITSQDPIVFTQGGKPYDS